jgi:hypothetical protein
MVVHEQPEILLVDLLVSFPASTRTFSPVNNIAPYFVSDPGIANGYCKRDMAADLKDALTSPSSTPRPGLIDPVAVGKLCRAIDGYVGKGRLVGLARPLPCGRACSGI